MYYTIWAYSGKISVRIKERRLDMDNESKPVRRSVEIFLVLFKIGFFTFGGGWSIIAQMEKEFIEKRQWTKEEDLLELISVAKSLPGIMIINLAVMFGYNMAGVIGALAAAAAIALPSVIILTLVTMFYDIIINNIYVAKAMIGVRAAVVPIIISAMIKLKKAALIDNTTYIIAIIAAIICLVSNINNLVIVVVGGLLGIIIRMNSGREKSQNAPN